MADFEIDLELEVKAPGDDADPLWALRLHAREWERDHDHNKDQEHWSVRVRGADSAMIERYRIHRSERRDPTVTEGPFRPPRYLEVEPDPDEKPRLRLWWMRRAEKVEWWAEDDAGRIAVDTPREWPEQVKREGVKKPWTVLQAPAARLSLGELVVRVERDSTIGDAFSSLIPASADEKDQEDIRLGFRPDGIWFDTEVGLPAAMAVETTGRCMASASQIFRREPPPMRSGTRLTAARAT